MFFMSIWDLRASRELDYDRWAFWRSLTLFKNVLKQVPIYPSCSEECCKAVLLWSSKNVLWITKLHPASTINMVVVELVI